MKRFNNVNITDKTNKLIDYIFESVESAKGSSCGGFREKGFCNVDSRFFTFVFLCGGNVDKHNSREVLTNVLKLNENIKIIISEKLAEYKGDLDLLTFEATLEAVSKMILIPVESFGTACELGAFTRIDNQQNKVVAIIDKDKINDNSFINYGPISLLKTLSDDRVFYATFQTIGEKKNLVLNSDLYNLKSHSLLSAENKVEKYFDLEEEAKITNLSSFFIAVLDLICLFGFINTDIVIRFFLKRFNVDYFVLKSHTMSCNFEKIPKIINTFFRVLESVGFLVENNGLFYADPNKMIVDLKNEDRWIGRVLFTKEFTRSDEYLKIKAECLKLFQEIKKYGYH